MTTTKVRTVRGQTWVRPVDATDNSWAMPTTEQAEPAPYSTHYRANECTCRETVEWCACACGEMFCGSHRSSRVWVNEEHFERYWLRCYPESTKQFFVIPISGYELASEVFDE